MTTTRSLGRRTAFTLACMAVLIIAGLIMWLASARAEPATSFYGRDGSYQGSAFTHGNQRSFTNSRGEFTGSSITHGNMTTYFDNAGRFQGSSVRQGTPSNPLTGR